MLLPKCLFVLWSDCRWNLTIVGEFTHCGTWQLVRRSSSSARDFHTNAWPWDIGKSGMPDTDEARNKMSTFKQYISVFMHNMMTSSNGNIFRVTGHLCGEFTGLRWIPRTKASDASCGVFNLRPNKRLSKQSWGWWFETLRRPLGPHSNEFSILIVFALIHPLGHLTHWGRVTPLMHQ